MERSSRPSRPHWQQALAAFGGLLFFVAAYLLAMRLSVDISEPGLGYSPDYRDTVYLWLHTGILASAAIAGFALGSGSTGRCRLRPAFRPGRIVHDGRLPSAPSASPRHGGHNDLIRHWTC
jgi:hypothetical protein